jgi:hypothetical protein
VSLAEGKAPRHARFTKVLVPQPLEGSNLSLIQLGYSYPNQDIHYRLRRQPGNGCTAEMLDVNHNITKRPPYAPLLLVEQARPR